MDVREKFSVNPFRIFFLSGKIIIENFVVVLWINKHLIICLVMYRSHNQLYCLQQLTVILLKNHNDSHWSTHVVPTVEK